MTHFFLTSWRKLCPEKVIGISKAKIVIQFFSLIIKTVSLRALSWFPYFLNVAAEP